MTKTGRTITLSAVALAAMGCATTDAGGGIAPASAQSVVRPKPIKTITTMTAADRELGAKVHAELLTEYGGAYTRGAQADYVRRIGTNIALQSGMSRAREDFTVTLLNSPVNNAFAVPGGYIYVTRQLMALMNDEAELAGVLGHEVGHVAAGHSRRRQSAATRNAGLGLLGTLLGSALGDRGLAGLLGGALREGSMQAAQLVTLGFSRSQEYEADQLGVQYLASAGYDPRALGRLLTSLENQTLLDARAAGRTGRSVPGWASTHPNPADRIRRAGGLVAGMQAAPDQRGRDAFFAALNGTTYGDDPAQGVVEGERFLHPDLRLAFQVPAGFAMQNGTSAVSFSGPGGQGKFAGLAYDGNLDRYVAAAFQDVAGKSTITPGPVQRRTSGGIPAATSTARVTAQSGPVDVTVVAYEFAPTRAYHFVTITPVGRAGQFDGMFASLRRLTDAEARAIRPRQIAVVRVARGDTIASLSARMAYGSLQQERFLTLNALAANSVLTPGMPVKLVVYGNR